MGVHDKLTGVLEHSEQVADDQEHDKLSGILEHGEQVADNQVRARTNTVLGEHDKLQGAPDQGKPVQVPGKNGGVIDALSDGRTTLDL